LDVQNNYVEHSNGCQNIKTLSSVLHYFDDLTKLFLDLAKFLDSKTVLSLYFSQIVYI